MRWWPTLVLALPLLALLLEASYSDLKTRKVPNKLILLYVGVAAAAQAVVVALWLLGVDKEDLPMDVGPWVYVRVWAVNAAFCWFAGVGMWWLSLWPAGEAKLFGVVCMLFPLWWIQNTMSGLFLGLSLLHNIFLAIFLQVMGDVVVQMIRWPRRRATWRLPDTPKKAFDWKSSLGTLVGAIVIFLFIRLWRLEFMGLVRSRFQMEMSLVYLLMVVLFHEFKHVMAKPLVFWSGVATLAGFVGYVVFVQGKPDRLLILISMSGYAISLVAIRMAYDYYAKVMNVRPVPIEALSQGMVLAGATSNLIKEDRGFFEENIETLFADGLTESQANNIKKWNQETQRLGDTVWVAHTTPIAPWIFLGTVFTVLAQGTLSLPALIAWLGKQWPF